MAQAEFKKCSDENPTNLSIKALMELIVSFQVINFV